MAGYTSFRCGGNAKLLLIPEDGEQLFYVLEKLRRDGEKFMILGNGSNVLFADEGYDGTVVHLGEAFSGIAIDGETVTAGAGALLSRIARAAADASLSGLEFASGIPGSLGGGIFMNAGAYDGEMKNVLLSVQSIRADGQLIERKASELGLGYRRSIFMDNGEVILSAKLGLKPGEKSEIEAKIADFTNRRVTKQPLQFPSAGSFFKRPEGYFAGKLIQDAGLKGLRVGGAMVSPLHAGFLINAGGATATDVIDLMKVVQETVMERFGVLLEPEVRIIGKQTH